LSNNRGFKSCKDCEECAHCKSLSRFRVSSCPKGPTVSQNGPEPPVLIPVYGSLSSALFSGIQPVINTNVDFSVIGPFSGTTPNIADDSITVNSQGIYTLSFSTDIAINNPEGLSSSVVFIITKNGIPNFTIQLVYATRISAADTLSRTDQLMLNQGDVIRVFIGNANGDVTYSNATLVVTKVA